MPQRRSSRRPRLSRRRRCPGGLPCGRAPAHQSSPRPDRATQRDDPVLVPLVAVGRGPGERLHRVLLGGAAGVGVLELRGLDHVVGEGAEGDDLAQRGFGAELAEVVLALLPAADLGVEGGGGLCRRVQRGVALGRAEGGCCLRAPSAPPERPIRVRPPHQVLFEVVRLPERRVQVPSTGAVPGVPEGWATVSPGGEVAPQPGESARRVVPNIDPVHGLSGARGVGPGGVEVRPQLARQLQLARLCRYAGPVLLAGVPEVPSHGPYARTARRVEVAAGAENAFDDGSGQVPGAGRGRGTPCIPCAIRAGDFALVARGGRAVRLALHFAIESIRRSGETDPQLVHGADERVAPS